MTDEKKAKLKSLPEDQLFTTHFALGNWIRNELIYRNPNGDALMEALFPCAWIHEDDTSTKIIEVAWRALQDE